MIDPKEFRIGNYFMWSPISSVGKGVDQIKSGYDIELYSKQKDPIPLTEEWLLRADFKKNEPFFKQYPEMPYWVNDGVCLFFNESDERNIYLLGFAEQRMGEYAAVGIRWIQYVHELQNGFALKGKELEIKPWND